MLKNSFMKELNFKVQGSAEEPYKVTFYYENGNLTTTYTCQAGYSKMMCKHRTNLINGDVTNLVSNNSDDILILKDWYQNSQIESLISQVDLKEKEADKEIKKIKKELKDLKKEVYKQFCV